jgi:phosphatidylethanolamine/phosphatidyl-N-methylethanolamine N-methyltransferase
MSAHAIKGSQSQRLYNLFAPFYDALLGVVEGPEFVAWRRRLWSKVEGPRVLEVGVGTGGSFPYYPRGVEVVAIDFSRNMLKRAAEKARHDDVKVQLKLMDLQCTDFPDNYFDAVVSSLVFCAVPDPRAGMTEVQRVLRNGCPVFFLEHVLSDRRVAAALMKVIDFPLGRITGEHISRQTVETIEKSGLVVEDVKRLTSLFRLIEARKRQVYL